MKKYKVLRPIRSDKKKKEWAAGDVVKDSDFPKYIIEGWLSKSPPVLEEVKSGSDN